MINIITVFNKNLFNQKLDKHIPAIYQHKDEKRPRRILTGGHFSMQKNDSVDV